MLSSSSALWPSSSLKRKTILSQGELFDLRLLLSYLSYITQCYDELFSNYLETK